MGRESLRKRKPRVDPRLSAIRKSLNFWWKSASGCAAIGTLLCVVGLATASWIILPPYTIRFLENTLLISERAQTRKYATSYLGLFLVYLNEGATIEPWYQRASTVCSGYQQLAKAAVTNGFISLWDGVCGTDCVDHFKMRCMYYKNFNSFGFVVLSVLLIVVAAAVTAIAWLYIFGKSSQFLRTSWLGGGVVSLLACGGYIWLARLAETGLQLQSYFPRFSIGYSGWCAVTGSILLILAGIIVAIAAHRDDAAERRLREEAIIKQEAGGVNFRIGGGSGFPGGISPGRNKFLPPPKLH